MGNLIANRDIEKVYAADPYSLVGVAGTAGIGIELLRLYQVELEHYEKIEGTMLSLDGKANRLATLIRNNLGAAMQGLAVVPIYAGYDLDARDRAKAGRIFSFDVVGGLYEESLSRDEAVRFAVESLYDAADDDTATGHPDPIRNIFPVVMTATADGAVRLTDEESAAVSQSVIDARRDNPGG
jgi:proteasome beta subunit